ncbi:MAG: SRPBCC domain-containing protein [Sphingobacteriales bacterium]|nr:MAG: SRPBCC domain-containing protein [Sphingobacteriales bacterium]
MIQTQEGLKIVREFDAPIDLVFGAFATAEAFAAWWGPTGMPVTVKSFDFRPGGTVHYKMEGNGQVMWGLFKFEKIKQSNLIQFVNSFSDEEGNICSSPFPMDFPLEIFNEIRLEESNGITTMTLQGHPVNATAAQKATYQSIKDNMQQGFAGTFDQLDAYLLRAKN